MAEKNGREKFRSWLVPVVMALALSLIIGGLDFSGLLEKIRLTAYDTLFYLRSRVSPPPEKPDAPVAVIGIDDETFKHPEFQIPRILWHNYFAAIIQGLADGKTKAIGLDFLLPQSNFDNLVPDYSRTWLKAILYARQKGTPVITGVVQMADRQIRPDARYLQIIGAENLGLFNLSSDQDDFVRRQRLYFPGKNGSDQGLYSITWLLARAARPDIEMPSQTVYIDYNASDVPFARYSFSDVYFHSKDGDVAYLEKHFKNKIVLIGETDALTQDRHPTPLYYLASGDHRRTSGVEILAHIVSTLLDGRFFKNTSLAARTGIYFLLALPVCLATLVSRRRFWPAVAPALLVIWSGASYAGYENYLILPWAEGLVVVIVSQAGAFSYRYLVADREKRRIRGAFSRYLSPQVVDQVIKHPELLSLGGTRRNMTAFFSDLAGFTSISESMSPEELVSLLNRYLGLMTGAILERGGTLDKYEGDAIMAFWGAPVAQEDHALRTCLAALEQQKRMDGFREKLRSEGLPELRARMGINTGPMIVGNMGSEERFDFTIMGDAVNLASRLEGVNKEYGTEIMISESTFSQVQDRVEVRELDLIRVKGKSEPIRVYELLGEKGSLTAAETALRDDFEKGLAMYRDGRFSEALAVFQDALQREPDDGPSRTYVARCRMFIEHPPGPDWDGVFTMATK